MLREAIEEMRALMKQYPIQFTKEEYIIIGITLTFIIIIIIVLFMHNTIADPANYIPFSPGHPANGDPYRPPLG